MNRSKRTRCETARKLSSPPATIIPIELRMKKRWIVAQARSKNGGQQKLNANLELSYFDVLSRAKRLWSGRNTHAFERDYRRDNTQNALAMYAFMTDSFYLYLECQFDFVYSLEFAFYKCDFEAELRELLMPLTSSFNAKEVALTPDLPTYFKSVMAYQPNHFHYFL